MIRRLRVAAPGNASAIFAVNSSFAVATYSRDVALDLVFPAEHFGKPKIRENSSSCLNAITRSPLY